METYERKPMQTVKRNWAGGPSCARSTPPAKTMRAKHTRQTTPTSPLWRFTNEPSRLVTSGGGRPDLEGRRENPCDGHMARFAFEALGIELTEGQPDTRQTKQTKRNPEL